MDKIELRKVAEKDWDFILNLRNEFYIDSFYEQKKPIEKMDHYKYMNKQITNPNFHQWVAIESKNGFYVGYIRILDYDINIMVDKKFQNKGVGTIMLKLVEEKAKNLGLKKLEARVLSKNKISLKLFEKNNFKMKMNLIEKEL